MAEAPKLPAGLTPAESPAMTATRTQVEKATTGTPSLPGLSAIEDEGRTVPGFDPTLNARSQAAVAKSRAAGVPTPSAEPSPERAAAMEASGGQVAQGVAEGASLAGAGFGAGAAFALPVKRWLVSQMPVFSKLPLSVLRVIFGAAGEEVLNDATLNPPGEGLKRGLIGGTAGEAVAGAAKLAPKVAVAAANRVPYLGKAMRERAAEKAAEAAGVAKAAEEAHGATVKAAEGEVSLAEGAARSAAGSAAKARGRVDDLRGQAQATGTQAAARGISAAGALADSERRAAELGTKAGTVAPTLAAAPATTTPERARELAQQATLPGDRRIELGTYHAEKLARGDAMLPEGFTARIPSMARENPQWTASLERLGYGPGQPVPATIVEAFTEAYGPRIVDRFTNAEIAEHLKQMGARAYRGKQFSTDTRTVEGRDTRQQIGRIMSEWQGEVSSVSPAAWGEIAEGRHAFSVGNELIRVLRQEGVFNRDPATFSFDMRQLQRVVAKNAQRLRDRMTDDEWNTMRHIVFEGGDVSTRVPSVSKRLSASEKAAAESSAAHAKLAAGEGRLAARETTAAGLQETAAQARARLEAIPPLRLGTSRVKSPWGDRAIGTIFLDAAIARSLSH